MAKFKFIIRSIRVQLSRHGLPTAAMMMFSFCWCAASFEARAQQAAPATVSAAAATARMKQAEALEAAGKYQAAAEAYDKAAKAFEAAGQSEQQAGALEKSAAMFEKLADQLTKQGTPKTIPATPKPALPTPATQTANQPAPAAAAAPQAVPAPAGVALLPLDKSLIVAKNPKGESAVAAKNGKPIEGIKLSRHDAEIYSPSIAVAPDGTIHVAFVEQRAEQPFIVSVYHRSSADGGKTWSEAKNLSEVLPGYQVGNCRVAVDAGNRVYVIWRTGVTEGFTTDMDAHGIPRNNLVYRVLAGGAWNGKVIFIPPIYKREDENRANASWFVSTDPMGKVHVVWNMPPHSRHPEAFSGTTPSFVVGNSMVMEADLNGTDPGTPHEVYCAKIAEDPAYRLPGSDDFDTIEGYVDAGGQTHFITHVTYAGVGHGETLQRIDLVENGKQTEAIKLPNGSIWRYPPKLLFDARGREHIIAMYEGGENPNIRDYLVGSDTEPTVIRAAKEVKGNLIGFQANQAPGGRMIVLMQMSDTGNRSDDELYLSTSDGGQWSPPVNVTNNTGRQTFAMHETSAFHASNVATSSYWYPGPAAATYDRQGHLVLAYISNEHSVVQSTALGWTLAGGSTDKPKLLFLRF